ncbi:hypothetical protein L7F22_001758 [Adiantum nelumboides]|nr:hypothetical protein [Adiantum nelumboides]
MNYYSWNKVSNILFVDSPAGVGWSYSNTSTDYSSFGDAETAQDSLAFLLGWLELFPEYKNSNFYISGESYAGHYVPQLASLVLAYKGSDGYKFNLKGIAIGNPLFQLDADTAATYEYLWSHGIISDVVYDEIVAQCNFEDYTLSSEDHNVSKSCNSSLVDASNELGDYVNNYDVILDVCYPSLVEQELRLRKKVAHMSNGVDVCITSERSYYFNTPEVQQALHANVTNLDHRWSMCSGVLEYHMEDANIDMLPSLRQLHMQGLRILVFSGDQDSVIPLLSTRTLVRQLAGELRLYTSVPYRAWYDKGQVGGWTIVYGKNLTFATVRGAAHMPQNNAENGAENDVQQPIVDDFIMPLDVDPLPDNVDHWVRGSTRPRRTVSRYDPSLHYIMLTDEGEPLTYKEAKTCEHNSKWELAMQEEIKALHAIDTWDLVELPKGRKAIPNKWVYKIKTVDAKPKYKARLVAKGCAQTKAIDFQEVFSSVVKMTTLRVLFAIVCEGYRAG